MSMTPQQIEALIESVVKRELRKLLTPLVEQESHDEWVGSKEAFKLLGFPSEQALYSAVRTGLFRLGKEVCDRRLPGRKKPRYQFNLAKCQKRLETDPDKRKVV